MGFCAAAHQYSATAAAVLGKIANFVSKQVVYETFRCC
jgi:hypothetical protein